MSADQSAGARVEFINPAFAQSYLWDVTGESVVRQFDYGMRKVRQHFPDANLTVYSSEEPCFTSALPGILKSFGFKYASLKNPNTCWGGYTRGFNAEVINWVGPDGTKIIAVPRYATEQLDPASTWKTNAPDNAPAYIKAALDAGIAHPVGMCLQDAGWVHGPRLGKDAYQPTEYVTWRGYFENRADHNPDAGLAFQPGRRASQLGVGFTSPSAGCAGGAVGGKQDRDGREAGSDGRDLWHSRVAEVLLRCGVANVAAVRTP